MIQLTVAIMLGLGVPALLALSAVVGNWIAGFCILLLAWAVWKCDVIVAWLEKRLPESWR